MTNKEKAFEVLEQTFDIKIMRTEVERWFTGCGMIYGCKGDCCDGCRFYHFWESEYKGLQQYKMPYAEPDQNGNYIERN